MKTTDELFENFPILEVNDEIILRQFTKEDVPSYMELYTIPEVNQFIPDSMIPRTTEEAKLEVDMIIRSFSSKQDFYWAIALKKSNKLIGGCGFHDWNRFNMRTEIAYDIHPNYWRKGIMFACIKEIIKFAFLEMKVQRIQATTVENNTASNKLLIKFGFKQEGVLYKYKFFKQKMVDILMFSYTIDSFKRDISLGKLI